MGCDIHPYAERKTAGRYELIHDATFKSGHSPFDWREYGMFGFLADVRNYSGVPPISQPRGIPANVSGGVADEIEMYEGHSASWLSVAELLAVDYDQTIEDLRVTVQVWHNAWDGGSTAAPGGGKVTTYRKFLGERFFSDLKILSDIGADRVVFWFDS
jgi:hypothetical protein